MGLVLLDLTFRVEKAFGIKLPKGWPACVGIHKDDDDATLGQFHDFLVELCHWQDVEPPEDSWDLLCRKVADVSGIRKKKLSRETWLVKDIAPYG